MRGAAYRKFRRKNGIFFAEEIATKKQFSLHTRDREQADLELRAHNDKAMGPTFNRQIAMAFLRNGLNPLLTRYQVACILNHHTPKTTNRQTDS